MTDEPAEVPQLPPRLPRSFVVHWLVDAAVLFLVAVVPALFLGTPWGTVLVVALVVALPLAPWTRWLELRALLERPPRDEPTP